MTRSRCAAVLLLAVLVTLLAPHPATAAPRAPGAVATSPAERARAPQVRWAFPRTARVGTRVTARIRFVPFVRFQRATLQQEVNGRWMYVGDAAPQARHAARISFIQVTTGPSRFRVRGPGGRFVVRTLRGIPSDTVLRTRRVSVTANGSQLDEGGYDAVSSDDGRFVAFTSYAGNAVRGDTNRRNDVYLKNTVTGAVRRVSHATGGREPGGDSGGAAISGDGSLVAFTSRAANLVPGDRNQQADLFLWRRTTGAVTRLAIAGAGPSLSADGRYVAYTSRRPGQVAAVEVADLSSGTTVPVGDGAGPASSPSISDDGTRVAFQQAGQVRVWERATGTVRTVAAGAAPRLSGDGTVLVHEAGAGGHRQVFRTSLAGGTPTMLTRPDGAPGAADSRADALSADGSVVVITSDAALTSDDVDRDYCESESECYTDVNLADVYVADATGAITLVSRSSTGAVSQFESRGGDVLADGSAVVLDSRDRLVPGQSTRHYYSSVYAYRDVFVRNLDGP